MDKVENAYKYIWGIGEKNNAEIPKIIWTFWDAPKPSPLVDICFEQIKTILPDYSFNIITKSNANDFISDLPDLRTDISFINYTDLVRLKLLAKYGGIWIDASVLLTQNLNWIHELNLKYEPDFIGFNADTFNNDAEYPLIETWFLATNVQNKFLIDWSEEFEKCYTFSDPHKYFENEKQTIPNFLQKIDDKLADYLIAYLAATKIMRRNNNYRLLLFNSSENAHYYNFGLRFEPRQTASLFLKEKNVNLKQIPFIIKFHNLPRTTIDNLLENGIYSKKSLLFKIVPSSYSFMVHYSNILRLIIYKFKNLV